MNTYTYYAHFEVSTYVDKTRSNTMYSPVEVSRLMSDSDPGDIAAMERIISNDINDLLEGDFVKVKVKSFEHVH